MEVNRTNLQGLTTAYSLAFAVGLGMVAPLWQRIAMRAQSTTKEQGYPWLGDIPGMREWLGDRQVHALKKHGYSIRNRSFELTLAVDRDDIEDDQYGVYSPLMQEMGRSASVAPDEQVFGLLSAGFSSLCYDGQYFFDTDHPVEAPDGTITAVSNMQSGSGAPWFLFDTSRAIQPLIFQERRAVEFTSKTALTDDNVFMAKQFVYGCDGRWSAGYGLWQLAFASKAALDSTAFNAARQSMESLKKANGQPAGVSPRLLVVGPSNRAAAEALIQAQQLANGASNTLYKAVDLLVCPWLA